MLVKYVWLPDREIAELMSRVSKNDASTCKKVFLSKDLRDLDPYGQSTITGNNPFKFDLNLGKCCGYEKKR